MEPRVFDATPEWLSAYAADPNWALALLADAGYTHWRGQLDIHKVEVEVECSARCLDHAAGCDGFCDHVYGHVNACRSVEVERE